MQDREETQEPLKRLLNTRCWSLGIQWLIRLLVCCGLFSVCLPIYAIDRDRKINELYHTSWTHMEGAPSEIRALAQTTDGYLWLGTSTGLFRFDGIHFLPYKARAGQVSTQRGVSSLFATPDGGLWVGYWFGGVSFIKNASSTDYGAAEGVPSRAVEAFARDRQGTIWAAAGKDGLARLEGSRWKKIGSDWGFVSEAYSVFVDHGGTLWVGTPTSVAFLVEGGHRFQIATQHLLPFVHSLAEGPDSGLWMAEGGYGVRPVPMPGKIDRRDGPAVLVGSLAIAFDNQGSLWVTSAGNGIRRVPYPRHLHPPQLKGPSAWQFHDAEVEAFTQRDGLTSDYVYCVLQDREGNIWIGTSGGLDQFRQSPVVSVPLEPISDPRALPIPSPHSFTTSALAAGAEGAVWASGMGPGVLLKIVKGETATQLRDHPVNCAYRDPKGALWLATSSAVFRLADERRNIPERGEVIYRYSSTERAGEGLMLQRLDLPKSGGIGAAPQLSVNAITQDRTGRLWISMESGTFRLEKSSWTSLASLGGPRGAATSEFTDSKGRIWFGFPGRIVVLDGDRIQTFSGTDGVQVGAITSIGSNGTEIWVGGESGVEAFDGRRFRSVNQPDGNPFGAVSGIVFDAEGGLWFSESRGIIHVTEAQLRQIRSGGVEFESFRQLDGLTADLRGSLASPSAIRTSDGRIWFATTKGLAWIDPKRILRNEVAPVASIEALTANGNRIDSLSVGKLPARTENLQITYAATSLTIPERVRFRYKLEGQDTDWQDAGTRREAFYTNLGPGTYSFRVIACNNDGVWSDASAVLNFSIAPAFYQTKWFRAISLVFFIAFIWMLYRLRVRSVEERYRERTRAAEAIAAEAATSLENTRLSRDLQERDRRIRRLVDADVIGIVIWDIDGRLLDANDAFLRMVQYDREDLKAGLEWFKMTPPEWQEAHARYEAEELKATGMMRAREKEYFRKDGSRVPVLIGAACFEDQPTQGVAYILDLSQQKRTEEALRRSEAYLAEAQRQTNTGSCAIDGVSRETVYWSDEMYRLFGFDPQNGPPKWEQFLSRIHPDDRNKVELASETTFCNKVSCDVEFRVVKDDGTIRHVHGIGHPALDASGKLVQVLGTMVDVTERKRAEEARERLRQLEADLARSNRMSVMGELTATLAHEIKQPIGAAVTNAEACLRFMDRSEPDLPEAREAALEAVKDARRAADIIDRVRGVYQKSSSQLELLDLNQLIEEMATMMSGEASRHLVTIHTELARGLPASLGDRVQLQQVFMNLMLNGIEAMHDRGGQLKIKSHLGANDQVEISISDTGVGVPAENIGKIFDAFFTTKPRGTGLGLVITRSIIHSHGGQIWATANSGAGATFHFTVPMREAVNQ